MLTVFSPAGFEDYLARLKRLTDEPFADEAFMQVKCSMKSMTSGINNFIKNHKLIFFSAVLSRL